MCSTLFCATLYMYTDSPSKRVLQHLMFVLKDRPCLSEIEQSEGQVVNLHSTYSSFDDFVLHVDTVHAQNVVAEVKRLKATLLTKQHYQCAAGPVHALTKQLPAVYIQSNPLQWIALGPDYKYPLRQSVHLSMFYTLHTNTCTHNRLTALCPEIQIGFTFLVLAFSAMAFSALTLLVGWQEGHPACKKLSSGVAICLERGADLHMAQLMPLLLTVSCFSKIQIGFTFLVMAHLGSPGKCVYVVRKYPGGVPEETFIHSSPS